MIGCDGCGAQAQPTDSACPVCGAPLARAAGVAAGPRIPIRRYGTVPLPRPEEEDVMLAALDPADAGGLPRRRPRRLGTGGAALLAGLAVALVAAVRWPW